MSDLPFMMPSTQFLALREADAAHTIPFWPRWMRTRWGQWLARHWAPARALWLAEVELAQHREDEAREAQAAAEAMINLQHWAERDFPNPMAPATRELLIGAWCKWRTYHERKCDRAQCAPLGSLSWIARQKLHVERINRNDSHGTTPTPSIKS